VEAFEEDKRLRLFAEMKLPGRAWLEIEVKEQNGQTEIHQTAIFDPLGLLGQLYWYALIFKGMLKNIIKAAEGGK